MNKVRRIHMYICLTLIILAAAAVSKAGTNAIPVTTAVLQFVFFYDIINEN